MHTKRLIAAIAGLAITPLLTSTAAADEPRDETDIELRGQILRSGIYFDFDKAELDDKARAELDKAAAWLEDNPEATLVIEGHTDLVGTPPYNRKLSDRRAEVTRDYLIDAGVAPERIKLMPYGETYPVVQTEHKERANRRVRLYSIHTKPIVKTETVTRDVLVEVPVTIRETVTKEVRAPFGYSLSLGGGVVQSLDGSTREITDLGGTWNVRFTAGSRAMLGGEVAYVGSAQDIDNEMGMGSSARLISNGAEGALRLALPDADLQPYAFVGFGMVKYSVVNANVNLDDNVVFFPAGVGLAYRASKLVFDLRATARAAFDDEIFANMTNDDNNSLSNWSTSAQVGFEF